MTTALDIDHLRTWIGRSVEAIDVPNTRLVEAYRATLEPYLAPTASGHAPLAMHWCLAPGAAPMADLSIDGIARGSGFMPDVPLPRRMWAGGEIATFATIPVGEPVVRRSTIQDVTLKTGSTGQLLFIAIEHDYLVGGEVAVRDRQNSVFREAAGDAAPAAPTAGASQPADVTWTIAPSAVLLFRYSALTFNSHRIHYDRSYTTAVEGYAGLIVHGPLQGSFAFNLAAVIGGSAPTRFTYRNLSPLTDDAPFHVKGAKRAEGTVEVWTEDHKGRTCMRGSASWG
jgi:3-methylfumaryl-CoA hydratase